MNAQFYREVIADLRRRGQAMLAGADDLERLVGAEPRSQASRPKGAIKGVWTKGRTKSGAGDDVILAVIREGAGTMNAIIAASKVKRHIASNAVRRLVAAKKVSKTGATKTLRYVAR